MGSIRGVILRHRLLAAGVAVILDVQRQYEELARTHPDGHNSDSVIERGGVT